jgi:hypothetical protein
VWRVISTWVANNGYKVKNCYWVHLVCQTENKKWDYFLYQTDDWRTCVVIRISEQVNDSTDLHILVIIGTNVEVDRWLTQQLGRGQDVSVKIWNYITKRQLKRNMNKFPVVLALRLAAEFATI